MSDVHVEATINVEGPADKKEYGGQISLRRVRGKKLVTLRAYSRHAGFGSVDVDPAKLRAALDQLVNEDLGK